MGDETAAFMEALASTDNFELFKAQPIISMIEYLYKPIKKWTLIRLFFPYCIFLCTYVFYADLLVSSYKYAVIDHINTTTTISDLQFLIDEQRDFIS